MAFEGAIDEEPGEERIASRPANGGRHSRQHSLSLETRALLLALVSGAPAVAVALVLLWIHDYPAKVQWTLSVLVIGCWWGFSLSLRERVIRPLQTVSNLLAA